ncbi:MAG: glycosyltransferase family 4 protein [Proteobacteria bacterium]|nr:glycosyltransferase family 4 protein [Pseudomonadota bacterium]
MRIALHTPSQPLNHPRTSGDVSIARDLAEHLREQGHEILSVLAPSSKWLWRRPAIWADTLRAARLATGQATGCDAWLTYQSHYKAPDVIGPWVSRRADVPYFILAGSSAQKRFWQWKSMPGYYLNMRALRAADHHFSHKHDDWINILRVISKDRTTCFRPGIQPDQFQFDEQARQTLRRQWNASQGSVVVSAAMFRPGVKLDGLKVVVKACSTLAKDMPGLQLVLAGDGPGRQELEQLTRKALPGRVRFLGRVPRKELSRVFSAGDVFAFPGIGEDLGVVYLKAQACGLPAVAWDHAGAPKVIVHGQSGLITPSWDEQAFASAIRTLLTDNELRQRMSAYAVRFVAQQHDIRTHYTLMESVMRKTVTERNGRRA